MTVYVPAELVTAVLVTLVASLVTETLAFAMTAPEESVTVPSMLASVWAMACGASQSPKRASSAITNRDRQSGRKTRKADNEVFMNLLTLRSEMKRN